MKKTFLLLCLLVIAGVATGQVKVNLNNALTVTFPSAPAKTKTDSNTTVYSSNLNSAYYLVTVKDMSNKNNLALYNDSLVNLYSDLVNTTIKKSRAKLVGKQYITINDSKAISFEYQMNDDVSIMPDRRFEQSVYINKLLISFSFWTFRDKLSHNEANKDIFFKSISKPGNDDGQTAQYNAPATTDTAIILNTTVVNKSVKNNTIYNPNNPDFWYVVGGALLFLIIAARLIFGKKKAKNDGYEQR